MQEEKGKKELFHSHVASVKTEHFAVSDIISLHQSIKKNIIFTKLFGSYTATFISGTRGRNAQDYLYIYTEMNEQHRSKIHMQTIYSCKIQSL